MKRLVPPLLLLPLLAVLAACDPGPSDPGPDGGNDPATDAGNDEPDCLSDVDCPAEARCEAGACVVRLTVLTEALEPAALGAVYDVQLDALGGQGAVTWYAVDLPGWLELTPDGRLWGTVPVDAVDAFIVVEVQDDAGQTDTLELSLQVVSCSPDELRPCAAPMEGVCMLGAQRCGPDGEYGVCVAEGFSNDPQHCDADCGACDSVVASDCVMGRCGCGEGGACADELICCQGGCVDTATDPAFCGGCPGPEDGETAFDCRRHTNGRQPPHAVWACQGGSCTLDCEDGWGDCDGLADTGCEVNLAGNPDHCGACGVQCAKVAPDGAESVACAPEGSGWACVAICQVGRLDCNGDPADGCEASDDQPETCGGCDVDCTQELTGTLHGTPICRTSGGSRTCDVSCSSTYADCDGDASNGCEVYLRSDYHCGACNVSCPSGEDCQWDPGEIPGNCTAPAPACTRVLGECVRNSDCCDGLWCDGTGHCACSSGPCPAPF